MVCKRILKPILENEAVTRGLADPEAKILIEWLVAQTEKISARESCLNKVAQEVDRLCLKARSLSRFVFLWGNPRSRPAACQLAATERFSWPLPDRSVDPCELMLDILSYETG